MSGLNKHTILLTQTTGVQTRTYHDFPTVTQCMKHIVEVFERELRRLNPGHNNFNYRVEDIFNFIDSMQEFNMLVFEQQFNGYMPIGKQGIKTKIIQYLNSITNRR